MYSLQINITLVPLFSIVCGVFFLTKFNGSITSEHVCFFLFSNKSVLLEDSYISVSIVFLLFSLHMYLFFLLMDIKCINAEDFTITSRFSCYVALGKVAPSGGQSMNHVCCILNSSCLFKNFSVADPGWWAVPGQAKRTIEVMPQKTVV